MPEQPMPSSHVDTNLLQLRTIYDLLSVDQAEEFLIPSYQRGYRWDSRQVQLLLQDIWDFVRRKIHRELKENEFYCLQPIVIKPRDDKGKYQWEVIDGQQRLTTLKLIIRYLLTTLKTSTLEEYSRHEFSIAYGTRTSSKWFLDNIASFYDKEPENKKNIDFFHMSGAYQAIHSWFQNKDQEDRRDFISVLLAKEDIKNPVKIIWYEVRDGSSSYDIFTRLNIGKIKLSNAELIKALFLKRWQDGVPNSLYQAEQLQIAHDWDRIESALQVDSFWHFLHNGKYTENYSSRIAHIFDLISGWSEESEEYHTFYHFNELFEQSRKNNGGLPNIQELWERVRSYFLRFDEWYQDRELYHLIGYLVATGVDIPSIMKVKRGHEHLEILNKDQFRTSLLAEIKFKLGLTAMQLSELNYQHPKVFKVLLLFNIQTLLGSVKSNERYPFDLHKTQNWDIEHIRSQTDRWLNTDQQWTDWRADTLEYFTGKTGQLDQQAALQDMDFDNQTREILEAMLKDESEKQLRKDTLQKHFDYFRKMFDEDIPGDGNNIANLALLDSYTNRSYKNAFYPLKRRRIQENQRTGIFTPICTRNVFLKAYSRKLNQQVSWSKADGEDYVKEIQQTISCFLNKN